MSMGFDVLAVSNYCLCLHASSQQLYLSQTSSEQCPNRHLSVSCSWRSTGQNSRSNWNNVEQRSSPLLLLGDSVCMCI